MKTAVLIAGEPRFSREFDLFLENLSGYDEIDWYFYLWKTPTFGLEKKYLSPFWFNIDYDVALNKLKTNLPGNHNIKYLELANNPTEEFPEITSRLGWATQPKNVWPMWLSWSKIDAKCNDNYDIVIRSRPDLGFMNPVDLKEIKKNLKSNQLILSNNHLQHVNNKQINDLIAISTQENMKVYNNVIHSALKYYNEGYDFHPETLLGRHLDANSIEYIAGNFSVCYRHFGRVGADCNVQFGRWE
jgi:hypothetical protein